MVHKVSDSPHTGSGVPTVLQTSALQAAAPIILALSECDEELRAEALELFKQLESDELDAEQRFATTALLAEILFPNSDHNGVPGLDLVEAEAIAPQIAPESKDILARMDEDEAVFAHRVKDLLDAKGWTQAELAAKVGIGQPAISMMLNRACRPQRKTVQRFAQAFGVAPEELWPSLGE
jgi:lambda repressor-like predicted transcriptional regulator